MPRWSNEIPKQHTGSSFPLRRTPAGKGIVALVTSDDLIGCPTHWWGGHTVPCEKTGCKPCEDGIPYRWHFYLAAVENHTHLHFLFEMTAQAGDAFKDYRKAHGTLRGCVFEAKRLRSAKNSRVCIRCKPADLREQHLPQAPDIKKCLAVIWNVPIPSVQLDGVIKDAPCLRIQPQPIPDPILTGNNHPPAA